MTDGAYTLTVEDGFNGICCGEGNGQYSVRVNGEEIVYGGKFSNTTVSHDILVGFEPPMSDRDKEWLDAHNTRRKQFHEENKAEYLPLVWSPELAAAASNWADQILPTCKLEREPGVQEGENISLRTSVGPRDNENPEDILTRWSDNKMGKPYPNNNSMTQVMWRATHYLGCADKFVENDNGSYCYVSICRYARAGNCNVNKYDSWLTPTLLDRTECGPICAPEGCY